MTDKVITAIKRYGMLEPGERVCVALSGGADSVALLLSLIELGYSVFAAHINHNLRGEEALNDQRFCEELCKRQGINLYTKSVDVRAYCKEKKCSVELGARELRYEALKKLAQGAKLATAHSLSDVLETVIFNLTRGCGVRGLTGIPPVREGIIRPLINCTRAEIEEYLSCKGQDFVTDSSNLEPNFSRNIIRLNVIPELRKINPGLEKSFATGIEAIREADSFIDARACSILEKFDGKAYDFTDVPDSAPLSRALAKMMKSQNIEPSYERITAAKRILRENGRINLKKGVYLRADKGKLSYEYDVNMPEFSLTVTLRESVTVGGGKSLNVTEISPFDISRFNKSELRYFFDKDKMAEKFTARHCLGGEKIRLPERGFTSTVKKLLSHDERRESIVIADAEGAVFVEGIGVAERVCCTGATVSAVKIDIKTSKETETGK